MTRQTMQSSTMDDASAGFRSQIVSVGGALGRVPLAVHQLLFRFAIAGVFLRAGLTKVASWETTLALFRDEYKVPILLFVYPSAWPEHLVWGSILLFLLTRGPGAISIDRLIGLEPGAIESRVA